MSVEGLAGARYPAPVGPPIGLCIRPGSSCFAFPFLGKILHGFLNNISGLPSFLCFLVSPPPVHHHHRELTVTGDGFRRSAASY
jgi:hypothetical protein